MIYISYLGWFWGNKSDENCKRKFCSTRILFTDRLFLVRWKDILDVHCTDRVTIATYRCIKEDDFDCKLQALPDLPFAF